MAPGELEQPLHVSEGLHQGDDGEVVCPGGGDQGRDVPEAPGRVRGHIGQWSPVREGVLVLQQQVRGPGPGQSGVSSRSRDQMPRSHWSCSPGQHRQQGGEVGGQGRGALHVWGQSKV